MSSVSSLRGAATRVSTLPAPAPAAPRQPRVSVELTRNAGGILRLPTPAVVPTPGPGKVLGGSRIKLEAGGVLRVGQMSTRADGAITPGTAKALYAIADELWRVGPDVLRLKTMQRVDGLTTSDRAALTKLALNGIGYGLPQSGKTSMDAAKARSGGALLLGFLIRSAPGTARDTGALIDRYLAACQSEPDALLREHMIRGAELLPTSQMSVAQRTLTRSLVDGLIPTTQLAAWLKKAPNGPIEIRHYVMSDFWRGEKKGYRDAGWKVVKDGETEAVMEKEMAGPNGKKIKARVVLRKEDQDVLRDLDDPKVHIITYSGHANLGGIMRASLDRAKNEVGDKLVLVFNCRGKQSLARALRDHPRIQMYVTDQSSYAFEDTPANQTILEGIFGGKTHPEIQTALRRQGLTNYAGPADARYVANMSRDGDGWLDGSPGHRDLLPAIGIRIARGERMSFTPKKPTVPVEQLDGLKVINGVEYFDTAYGYYLEDFAPRDYTQVHDRIEPAGWYMPDPGQEKEILRVTEEKVDGKPVFRVAVNAYWSGLQEDMLAALICFAMTQEMEKRLHPRTNGGDETVMLRGLAIASSYIENIVEYTNTADVIIRQLTKLAGLPELDYEAVRRATNSDFKHEASEKWLASLRYSLKRAANNVA
jgi:hypothetical protein